MLEKKKMKNLNFKDSIAYSVFLHIVCTTAKLLWDKFSELECHLKEVKIFLSSMSKCIDVLWLYQSTAYFCSYVVWIWTW